MPQNCLGTIRSYYPKFSEKEKKIADYILEKPEVIIHKTINEVADDLNIADATVFRFSKRIGFKGFQAMKIALASETMTPLRPSLEELLEKDNKENPTEKIFKAHIGALQKTMQSMDMTVFKNVIDIMMNAKKVEVFGTGSSSAIAMIVSQKLLHAGIRASAFAEAHSQILSASHLTGQDVALFLSQSGANKETMAILKAANGAKAKTIAITGFPNSPISLNAGVSLTANSDETEQLTVACTTQIVQLSIIDALCYSIATLQKEKAMKNSPTVLEG